MSERLREGLLCFIFIFIVGAAITCLWCGCGDEPVDSLVTLDAGEDYSNAPVVYPPQNQPDTSVQPEEPQTCFIEYYVVSDTCLFYWYRGENCPRPPWWIGQDCNFETWEFPWDIRTDPENPNVIQEEKRSLPSTR